MSKFYVGQKVLVKSDTYLSCEGATAFIGSVCTVTRIDHDCIAVMNEEKRDWFHFKPEDLEPITETPKEITLNGATYVLKEEPKPEHEWKFGDIAAHEKYGVGILFSNPYQDNAVFFAYNGGWNWAYTKDLTFLRRADLSV